MVRDPILLHFCASAPKGQISMPPSKCINCIHYGTGKHGSSAQRTRFNTLLNEEWKKRRRRTPRVALTPAFDVAVYEFGSTHILWLQCGQPNHPDQALDWIAGTVCLKLVHSWLPLVKKKSVRHQELASKTTSIRIRSAQNVSQFVRTGAEVHKTHLTSMNPFAETEILNYWRFW